MKEYVRRCVQEGYFAEMDEVQPVFAFHAKWILSEHEKKKFINKPSWERLHNTWVHGHRYSSSDDEMEGDTPNSATRLTRSGRKAPSRRAISVSSSSSPSPESSKAQTHLRLDKSPGNSSEDEYINEILIASSPERSPSPAPLRKAPLDTRMYALIPKSYNEEPFVPKDFIWSCDTRLCEYRLNLLDPLPQDLRALTPHEAAFLKQKSWKLDSDSLRGIFESIVHFHRIEHLRSWNIGVNETGFPPLYWIKPLGEI